MDLNEVWWIEAETANKATIPLYLKNLLMMTEFDNLPSLEGLDTQQVEMMESFAQTEMENLIDPENPLTDYYGIYGKYSKNFKILPGHRILLKELRDYCRKLKNVKLLTNKTIERKTLNVNQVERDFGKEEKHILKLLKDYINRLTEKDEYKTIFKASVVNNIKELKAPVTLKEPVLDADDRSVATPSKIHKLLPEKVDDSKNSD
ncbi:uncharacterized protein LOC117174499 isoform X2 [Belonocnema kinseyi]|uniref:uncharacterized protein LOC117174499 isoform X2 n=1 Tax=Belonocnema kinseyi TaxID=2817044 RepID=UPI00143CC1F6|nr:uncharacterized protein LOC117174499 isoform X2 [Belonocnema kinseyi]